MLLGKFGARANMDPKIDGRIQDFFGSGGGGGGSGSLLI